MKGRTMLLYVPADVYAFMYEIILAAPKSLQGLLFSSRYLVLIVLSIPVT